jgi:hypothetical protein
VSRIARLSCPYLLTLAARSGPCRPQRWPLRLRCCASIPLAEHRQPRRCRCRTSPLSGPALNDLQGASLHDFVCRYYPRLTLLGLRSLLASVEGEWHEFESRRAARKARP